MAASPTFLNLRVEGWRQFDFIDIDLHPRLTVLTGANGAGKSSLLRIFSRHLGFDRPFLATPYPQAGGAYRYITGIFQSLWSRAAKPTHETTQVGTIKYSNNIEATLSVPREGSIQYSISISNQQAVSGIHIDSHRPFSQYQTVAQIPTNIISSNQAYSTYNAEVVNKYQGGGSGYSPVYRMKEAIISMATFGEGNKYVQGNTEVLSAYLGFVAKLRMVLPDTLGFRDLSIRPPEIVLITESGEFLLDASSGGIMTLIDIVWRLHMFSLGQNSFVVTMDEPENHLHPTMQRSLMPRLLSAFPEAQFVIATHSPFMVSSVRDSTVYVLRYTADPRKRRDPSYGPASRIVSERLDTINKAGSASDILREVLGVSATIPEWVEAGLDAIVARYRQRPITAESLRALRKELATVGYDELYPDALAALTHDQ